MPPPLDSNIKCNAPLLELTCRPSNRHGAHDYKYPQNTSPALRINEGHKLADFYSATTAIRSRFCGPVLLRVLQDETTTRCFAQEHDLRPRLRPSHGLRANHCRAVDGLPPRTGQTVEDLYLVLRSACALATWQQREHQRTEVVRQIWTAC